MLVKVRKMRHHGRKLRRLEIGSAPSLAGELTLSTTHHKGSGAVPRLNLQERHNQTPEGLLAVLYEPQLVSLVGDGMRFRGIESVADTGYVQEWLIELVSR
jgi:hypothetical protein